MKQLVRFFLLIVLSTLIGLRTYAEELSGVSGNISWNLDTETGVLTLSGSGSMRAYDSNSIDGHYVTTAPWGNYYTSIKLVDIQSGVTSIGNDAFFCCSSLTSVTIPEGVTSIGSYAFYGCSSLTSVTIPSSVTSIGSYAFGNVDLVVYLRHDTFPSFDPGIGNNVLFIVPDAMFDAYAEDESWSQVISRIYTNTMYEKEYVVTVDALPSMSSLHMALGEMNLPYVANLKVKGSINGYDLLILRNKMIRLRNLDLSEAEIVANDGGMEYYTGKKLTKDNELGAYAFYGSQCPLASVKLPNSLEAIGTYAFSGKTALQEIDLPESLKTIGNYAFSNCSKLMNVSFGNSLQSIGSDAFYNCIKLTNVSFGNSLQSIGSYAFSGCSSLQGATIPVSVTSIGTYAFQNCTSMKEAFINANASISNYSFKGCSSLKKVLTGNKVTSIGSYAFQSCSSLVEAIIGNGVSSIGSSAFSGCSKLTDLSIGQNVTRIDSYAFSGCGSLQQVSLPVGLKTIGSYAFSSCSALAELRIPSSVTSISDYAFSGCNALTNVYTYLVEPQQIGQNTFSAVAFNNAMLNVPKQSYYNYYYDTQWSQFTKGINIFNEPYEYFYIDHDYTINASTGVFEGDPNVDMNPTSGLIVNDDIEQHFDTLHVYHNGQHGASLISHDNVSANCVLFHINVSANKWYFFSFPFDIRRSDVTCSGAYVFRYYDGDKRAKGGNGWTNIDDADAWLHAGQGYIFRTNTTGELCIPVDGSKVDFSDSDKLKPLNGYAASSDNDASWNFVGNPYLCYYDIEDLANEYNAPITVWNGSSYVAYRPGEDGDDYQLKPFEAFFVQKPHDKASIDFRALNRLTRSKADHRNEQRQQANARRGVAAVNPDRLLLTLTLSDGENEDRTRVVLNEKASLAYELSCDAAKFLSSTEVPQLWSIGEGDSQYAINERPAANGDVALGIRVTKDGFYTFTATRMDTGMVLVDNETGISTELSTGTTYSFHSKAGTFNERFILSKNGATAIQPTDVDTMEGEYYTPDGRRIDKNEAKGVVIVKKNGQAVKTVNL